MTMLADPVEFSCYRALPQSCLLHACMSVPLQLQCFDCIEQASTPVHVWQTSGLMSLVALQDGLC